MNIRHSDIEIPINSPFANCKLDREKYAAILTDIINNYSDGFVMAVNNEWGTGKTTFVKMWRQQLSNDGFETLYFNAWENDFESNPLVPLMSELSTLTDTNANTTFKSLLQKGSILIKSVVPSLIKAVADKYIDTKGVTEAMKNVSDASLGILEDELNEYAEKKKGLIEFRDELTKFIRETSPDKPIVFIIDELDRCRPNYAVEVLEQIKHFFSVKGIVFVLSIDKVQLGHAIRGVYGSEQINSEEYLRRFIDLEYSIPKPNTKIFCEYLFDYFSFDDFFSSTERKANRQLSSDKDDFIIFSTTLFDSYNLNLRQQEKMFAHARLGLKSFASDLRLYPSLYIFLIFIKTFNTDFYYEIESKSLTLLQLLESFNDTIKKAVNSKREHFGVSRDNLKIFIYLEVWLVGMYNHYYSPSNKLLIKNHQTGEITLTIKSNIDNTPNQEIFTKKLDDYLNAWETHEAPISYLINKINLHETILN